MIKLYVLLTLVLSWVIWRCFYISVSRMGNPFLHWGLNKPFSDGLERERERASILLALSSIFMIFTNSQTVEFLVIFTTETQRAETCRLVMACGSVGVVSMLFFHTWCNFISKWSIALDYLKMSFIWCKQFYVLPSPVNVEWFFHERSRLF